MNKVTAIVLTKNEEKKIDRCLEALKFTDEIIVIDDYSSDNTVKIAEKFGVKIIKNSLTSFSQQRNLGMKNAFNEWVLFVDADEIISKELSGEIKEKINDPSYDGYLIKRNDNFLGRDMKHGDLGNVWLMRLARKSKSKWIGDIHETLKIEGATSRLKNTLLHSSHENVSEFITKIDKYSTMRANELKSDHIKSSFLDILVFPCGKFLYLYFLRLGFLDGIYGFIHAIFMSMYSFMVRGKLFLLIKGER